MDDDLGRRLLDLLGERGCVELLADLLADVEADDLTRLRLIGALWEVLGPRALPAADRGPPFSDGIEFASDRWRPPAVPALA